MRQKTLLPPAAHHEGSSEPLTMSQSSSTRSTKDLEGAPRSRRSIRLRLALGVAALIVLIVVGRYAGGYVPRFATWVNGLGLWGPIVFIIGYALATVAFVPGSLLTLAAGAIFGLARGTLFVFIAATIGASGAFLVARYLVRKAIERRIESRPNFAAIDRAVGREGLKIVTLLRLSPIVPFNLLNYALGLTRVRFIDYLIACLGMLPGTFLYIYYGKALGDLAAVAGGVELERGTGYWTVFIVGLVATATAAYLVTRIARRALRQEVKDV
jgi:uncharacterized membrane protein YdjX (TVP38/TMEM64 family)